MKKKFLLKTCKVSVENEVKKRRVKIEILQQKINISTLHCTFTGGVKHTAPHKLTAPHCSTLHHAARCTACTPLHVCTSLSHCCTLHTAHRAAPLQFCKGKRQKKISAMTKKCCNSSVKQCGEYSVNGRWKGYEPKSGY